ncbi:selenium cofactor biosynthesis protein YqeC [Proteinivorax tanatarense]|uniref:Selenium cofactor biosynthesis protein YqeC n=1 Tax=Proteinivorax tanatarense TaxID=1260629 RepID=A0AAU7VMZ4_9FIRM
MSDIIKGLDLNKGDFITFVGGGGKTTGVYSLGKVMDDSVLTTTTKMFPPKQKGVIVVEDCLPKDYKYKQYLLVEKIEKDILKGLDKDRLADIYDENKGTFICEGDGARMKPLKLWASHEPAIPANSNVVLSVIGASVLGKKWDRNNVHRDSLLNLDGEVISFATILKIAKEGFFSQGVPSGASLHLVFNQWDKVKGKFSANELLEFAQEIKKIERRLISVAFISFTKEKLYYVF